MQLEGVATQFSITNPSGVIAIELCSPARQWGGVIYRTQKSVLIIPSTKNSER